jgi:translocation and assembly module TamA
LKFFATGLFFLKPFHQDRTLLQRSRPGQHPEGGSPVIMKLLLHLVFSLVFLMAAVNPALAEDQSVQVDIKGLEGAPLQNVKTALTLPQGIVRNGVVEENWLNRYVGKLPKLAAEALEPFGYYRSKTTVEINEGSGRPYHVLVRIDPGPQMKIRAIVVNLAGAGRDKQALVQKVNEFPLKQGDVLDHQLYEKGKLELRLEANDQGYIKAAYSTHAIHVHPEENVADIELVLDTGPRFYFGETFFIEDKGLFDEAFLRRFLVYKSGDTFSHKELHLSRLNFYRANRFDEVLMIPLIEEAVDQRVPVKVTLRAGKQQRLRPGIGYGTNTGARVSLSYHNMQVGKSPNSYLFDLILAEKAQSFENSYTIPQKGGADNNLIGTLGLRREDLDTYRSRMFYAEVEESYGLGQGKVGSIYLRYLKENSNVSGDENVAELVIPGIRYHQRSYDDPLNPAKGYQFRLELRGSYDGPVSNVTLGQAIAAGSFMWPLSPRLILHPRIEAATTVKDNPLSEVPPSMRFFVGGDNSVRGYAYKSRGPEDSDGDVVGGDSLLVGSLEVEYVLNDDWGLAVFYDIGSAFDATHDMDFIEGAGIGVRRYTPVGPVKLDLATRVNDSNGGIRLHFSMGFDL